MVTVASAAPDDSVPTGPAPRSRSGRAEGFPFVVGMGASAGGIEAFKQFFQAMPADSGLAFAVVLHLAPEHSSALAEVLGRHTAMPVREARDRLPIEPNHVYVIPPGKYLTLRGKHIHLRDPDRADLPRAPVDALFRSLADEQQERAIGVILSGMGANGSLGLREIKARGGMVAVQDPATAAHDSMPVTAIATGLADCVLPPDKMPQALLDYVRRFHVADDATGKPDIPESDLDAITRVLRSRVPLDFGNYKPGTLNRRIARRMGLRNVATIGEYVERLRSDPHEAETLARDLLIRVTSFFREPAAFEILSREVVPELVAHSEQTGTIRVWVPACATGEEAYSLAMLIFDRLQAERRTADVKVFASDVDGEAIRIARAAVFPEAIADDVPEDYLTRFFVRRDHGYQIAKPLRDAVVFAVQNVVADPPFSRLDLVSCRNLLIYLQPEAQRRLIALFHFALRAGGWLFLGSAESVGDAPELFAPARKKQRIYRRIGPTRHDLVEFPPAADLLGPVRQPPPGRNPQVARWVDQAIVRQYAPACVVINADLEVLYFSGPTHEYLQQPIGEPTRDLPSLAGDELAVTLRVLVREAIDTGRSVVAQGTMKREGETIAVRCAAVPLKAPHEATGLLLLSFENAARVPAEFPLPDATRVMHLEQELSLARGDLTATLDRFETSDEEHQAAVEEIRSMNEELQSMNEELETSKEELQSLNEELTSVNQQLEVKVAELESVTDDLQNLLRSTEIATVFLDRNFCIRRFTPAVRTLLNLIPGDIGRPIGDIARKFTDDSLLRDTQAVLEKLTPLEAEVSTPGVHWYIRRVLPYRTEDDRIGGVVITFTEITRRKRAEQDLAALARSLERQVAQRTKCIRLLQDVAVVANEAASVDDAVRSTLQRVCQELGWPVGHAFFLDEDEGVFVDSGIWHLTSAGAAAGLVEASRSARFAPAEGAIGRAVESAGPVWVRDAENDPSFLRAKSLEGSGLRSALAFPVRSRSQVVGVLEFFSTEETEPDRELVEGLREIGTQLGRVIERKQLEREVAEATAHEQRFVGQELHDTISQDIAGIDILIGRLEQELKSNASPLAAQARAVAHHLQTTRDHVRQLAHGLMPVEIESSGLLSALQTLAATCRELHGIDCTVQCDGTCELESSTVAMHVYRIAQEALQNALRHGKASRVEIILSSRSGTATLTIRDNGAGFDPQTQQPGGIGLQIMRYRAGLVGAKLDMQARPGEGTEVVCTFPCTTG